MNRLTFEGNFCDISMCTATPRGSFCEDGACSQRKVWERLKAIEDILGHEYELERLGEMVRTGQSGRLKVGDMVYQADDVRTYTSTIKSVVYDTENIAFDERAIGKTIFLTREAAEAALAKGEKNETDPVQH